MGPTLELEAEVEEVDVLKYELIKEEFKS